MKIFLPIEYDTAKLLPNSNVSYWKLPTGSTIAYYHLQGNALFKKEYPVIYLHGGPGAGITSLELDTYRMLAAEGYDIYLYDQVGCGHSQRLKNIKEYTVDRHFADLNAIVETIGSEKIIIAGQSWGSILALTFAARRAEKVHRLIVTAPAPVQPLQHSYTNRRPPDSLKLHGPSFKWPDQAIRKPSLRVKTANYLARKFSCKLMDDSEADAYACWTTHELNKAMVCDSAHAVPAEGTEGYYAQFFTSKSIAQVPDYRSVFKKLEIPVLIMKAQCDNQPWGYTQEYLDLFRHARLQVIAGAGHNAFIEQAEMYVNSIRLFLKE